MLNESYKLWHKPNLSGTKSEGGTSRTHQGYYKIQNLNKYVGNPNLVIYRSGWELSFCKWCDCSPSIIKWSSEPIKIPYYDRVSKLEECKRQGLDPNNPRNWIVKNYNTDFYIEIQKDENVIEKAFIEIKPSGKLKKPIPPGANASLKEIKRFNLSAKEFLINEAKFASITAWAEKNNCKFYVFTEHTLSKLLGSNFFDNQ
ncbi:hypothetical protein M0Q50_04905 [bacterium]|jgi:hypothetical protein|nr:hypothetical protein [bacterium]